MSPEPHRAASPTQRWTTFGQAVYVRFECQIGERTCSIPPLHTVPITRAGLYAWVTLCLCACAEKETVKVECPPSVTQALHDGTCILPDGNPLPRQDSSPPDSGPCGQACNSSSPICDEVAHRCVECLGANDCRTPKSLCNLVSNTCVVCLSDEDCKDQSKARCNTTTGTCETCTADVQCTHLAATPVCHESTGKCVECTPDTEVATCGTFGGVACHPQNLTCSGAILGSVSFCHACISDSECMSGPNAGGTNRCVPTTYGNPPVARGGYCLSDITALRAEPGKSNSICPNQIPIELNATSIGGMNSLYCFPDQILTTCEAIIGFRNPCNGDDHNCGAMDLPDDGLCKGNVCTYRCGAHRDCLMHAPPDEACTGGPPRYCNPN